MGRSTDIAKEFVSALERRDLSRLPSLLSDDCEEILPLNADGSPEPAAVFSGRENVMRVQEVILRSFRRVAFLDPEYTESADGATVFLEARGERVHTENPDPYRNLYVLKFQLRDGLIVRIVEYSNPVAFARYFGRSVG